MTDRASVHTGNASEQFLHRNRTLSLVHIVPEELLQRSKNLSGTKHSLSCVVRTSWTFETCQGRVNQHASVGDRKLANNGNETFSRCVNYVQYQRGCAVLARHIFSISEGVQCWRGVITIVLMFLANTEDVPRQYCLPLLILHTSANTARGE